MSDLHLDLDFDFDGGSSRHPVGGECLARAAAVTRAHSRTLATAGEGSVVSTLNRRAFLSGMGTAAAVAGFDPLTRLWVTQAQAAGCPSLRGCPRAGRRARVRSGVTPGGFAMGNIVHRTPCAVLRPGSVADIQRMIRYCRRHDVQVACRGRHHSVLGQGVVAGLIIETAWLNRIHSLGPDGAEVDAGATWNQVPHAAFDQGLKPRGMTGYTSSRSAARCRWAAAR